MLLAVAWQLGCFTASFVHCHLREKHRRAHISYTCLSISTAGLYAGLITGRHIETPVWTHTCACVCTCTHTRTHRVTDGLCQWPCSTNKLGKTTACQNSSLNAISQSFQLSESPLDSFGKQTALGSQPHGEIKDRQMMLGPLTLMVLMGQRIMCYWW